MRFNPSFVRRVEFANVEDARFSHSKYQQVATATGFLLAIFCTERPVEC